MNRIRRRAAFRAAVTLTCIAGAPLANAQVSGTFCNNMISPNAPSQPAAHYVGDVITLRVNRTSLFDFVYGGSNTDAGEGTVGSAIAPGTGPASLIATAFPGTPFGNCTLDTNILPALVAQISSINGSLVAVNNITFNGSSSGGGGGNTYLWDFGDGTSSTQRNATHAYGNTGTYTVQFTVTDQYGRSDTVSQTLAIVDNPNVPGAPSISRPEFVGCNFMTANFVIRWSATGAQPSNYYAYQFKPGGATSFSSVEWRTTPSKTQGTTGTLAHRVRVRGCLSASESTCGPASERSFYAVRCNGGGGEPL